MTLQSEKLASGCERVQRGMRLREVDSNRSVSVLERLTVDVLSPEHASTSMRRDRTEEEMGRRIRRSRSRTTRDLHAEGFSVT